MDVHRSARDRKRRAKMLQQESEKKSNLKKLLHFDEGTPPISDPGVIFTNILRAAFAPTALRL
jgi:hypothetical protein